jgi:hypothetical protein
MLQAGRLRVQIRIRSLDIFSMYVILGAALGSTQPLTEMNTMNTPGGKGKLARKLNSVAIFRRKLYRPSDRRLSAKLVSTFVDIGYQVDPYCRILGFLDRSRYFFFQVAHQLYSRG